MNGNAASTYARDAKNIKSFQLKDAASSAVLKNKEAAIAEIQAFMDSTRFTMQRVDPSGKTAQVPVRRTWTAEDVYRHREAFHTPPPVALKTSEKFWNTLRNLDLHSKELVSTFGVQNAAQARELVMEGFQAIYVSGWTVAASGDNGLAGVRPDVSVWPFDALANWVRKIRGVLADADRQQTYDLMTDPSKLPDGKVRDFLVSIIADVESYTGLRLMEMVRLVILEGASAVHCEDQTPEEKRCGHMGGKCVVSVAKHIENLLAIRFQADIMGVPLVIIARTDTNGAFLLTDAGDPRDHPFLRRSVSEHAFQADEFSAGLSGALFNKLVADGLIHGDNTDDATRGELTDKADALVAKWKAADAAGRKQLAASLDATAGAAVMRELVNAQPVRVQADKDVVNADGSEGTTTVKTLYRFKGGAQAAAARCLAYCEYTDLLWVETKVPDLEEAKYIADRVHERYPDKLLAYNLSPSFNWKKYFVGKYGEGKWEAEAAAFCEGLAQAGYKYQFITLAGHHANEQGAAEMATRFRDSGMLGYATFQASETKRFQEHQKYAGVPPFDDRRTLVTGSTEQSAGAGKSFTGTQF